MTQTLYRSGSVYAPGTPRGTALLVDDDAAEIVWIGTDEAAARLGRPDAVVDLAGALVAPAFVDAGLPSAAAASIADVRREAAALGIGAWHEVVGHDPAAEEHLRRLVALDEAGPHPTIYRRDAEQVPEGARALAVRTTVVVRDEGTAAQLLAAATASGRQCAIEADSPGAALRAAAQAASLVGTGRFGAAGHRLHGAPSAGSGNRAKPVESVSPSALSSPMTSAEIAEAARLGLVAVVDVAAVPEGPSLRELAAAGVPLALAGGLVAGQPRNPWSTVHAVSTGTGMHGLSVRAAFAALTRGGRRAARQSGAGELRPGARATFALWDFAGELVVRTPDARVAAWSTDPRAATPGLPDLEAGAPWPLCRRCVVGGVVVHRAAAVGKEVSPEAASGPSNAAGPG